MSRNKDRYIKPQLQRLIREVAALDEYKQESNSFEDIVELYRRFYHIVLTRKDFDYFVDAIYINSPEAIWYKKVFKMLPYIFNQMIRDGFTPTITNAHGYVNTTWLMFKKCYRKGGKLTYIDYVYFKMYGWGVSITCCKRWNDSKEGLEYTATGGAFSYYPELMQTYRYECETGNVISLDCINFKHVQGDPDHANNFEWSQVEYQDYYWFDISGEPDEIFYGRFLFRGAYMWHSMYNLSLPVDQRATILMTTDYINLIFRELDSSPIHYTQQLRSVIWRTIQDLASIYRYRNRNVVMKNYDIDYCDDDGPIPCERLVPILMFDDDVRPNTLYPEDLIAF